MGLCVVVGIGLLLGIGYGTGFIGKEPAAEPKTSGKPGRKGAPEETFRPLSEIYAAGTGAVVDPATDEPRVVAALEAFGRAEREGETEKCKALWNFRRLVAEIETLLPRPLLHSREEEDAMIRGFSQGPGSLFASPRIPEKLRWKRLRVVKVRLMPEKSEAEATCAVTFGTGARTRFVFRLIKEKDEWGIFDEQDLYGGFRLTAMVAVTLQGVNPGSSGEATESAYAQARAVSEALRANAYQDARPLLEAVARARSYSTYPALLPFLDVLEGNGLAMEQRYEEALRKYGDAESRGADIPMIHFLKANAHAFLGHWEETIRFAEEFMKLVGECSDAYDCIGIAYTALRKPDRALEALKKGVAADEEDANVRFDLALVLAATGRSSDALTRLRDAVRLDPSIRSEAAVAPEFEPFRGKPEFEALLKAPDAKPEK